MAGLSDIFTALNNIASTLSTLIAKTSLSVITPVVQGGTGLTTIPSHAVLIGNGANPINTAGPGTAGQMLLGVSGGDPVFGNNPIITGGTIDGAVIGSSVKAAGSFTNLTFTGTLTAPAGSISNADLANSSITIAGHTVSLGGTQTLAASDLTNGTTGSGAVVLATNATLSGATVGATLVTTPMVDYTPSLVSALPAPGTVGRKRFVSDATATTFASIVAGGSSNPVPVYDDGTNWRIG